MKVSRGMPISFCARCIMYRFFLYNSNKKNPGEYLEAVSFFSVMLHPHSLFSRSCGGKQRSRPFRLGAERSSDGGRPAASAMMSRPDMPP